MLLRFRPTGSDSGSSSGSGSGSGSDSDSGSVHLETAASRPFLLPVPFHRRWFLHGLLHLLEHVRDAAGAVRHLVALLCLCVDGSSTI